MTKHLPFCILCFLFISFSSFTQSSETFWKSATPPLELEENRYLKPSSFKTFEVDFSDLKSFLNTAPEMEAGILPDRGITLSLPHPDGGFKQFLLSSKSIMDPELERKFPEIRTFTGKGIEDHTSMVKIDHTPHGFHAMVLTNDGSFFIDPYSKGNTTYYIVYHKKDYKRQDKVPFECGFNKDFMGEWSQRGSSLRAEGDCQLRTYRLAISATTEYTTFQGGTVALAQAAQVTTMNRVNGLFERDMAVTMVFIGNNNLIIYAGADPFTNGNTGAMINENQTNTDAVIGAANYDIGHIFGTNSGGLAQLNSPCSGNKARGVTGSAAPVNDPFDVDYVAHEMGHQYGATHTQNNPCNNTAASQMEPGSASTILGYAGICAPDVQGNSDAVFHSISIQQMSANVIGGPSSVCPVMTPLANGAPVANAGSNYAIPVSTPFTLIGSATDPDGDVLSYTWEQRDNETATMPPLPTNTGGPAFRAFLPKAVPSRTFPNWNDLVNNISPIWEVLPSVSRIMNFRFTVRDNSPGAGCTDSGDMTVTTTDAAGPFLVTSPNTAVTWTVGQTNLITWDVANTDAAPVNCPEVTIIMSTDGGITYPETLATNVPNDGSHMVAAPNLPGNQTRILIICSSNIFFDISNEDFVIELPPEPDYYFTVDPFSQEVCAPNDAIYTIDLVGLSGFLDPVDLTVTGLPSGATATFSTNPVVPDALVTLTISNTLAVTQGSYPMTIEGNGNGNIFSSPIELTIYDGSPTPVTLSGPADGALGIGFYPTLTWFPIFGSPDYTVEIATLPTFGASIIETAGPLSGNSYTILNPLAQNSTYYWRVNTVNECGIGALSPVYSFSTSGETCTIYNSVDVPINILAATAGTYSSDLTVGDNFILTDVNVLNLEGVHGYIEDMVFSLESPGGTSVSLFGGICGNNQNWDLNFDDTGLPGPIPCPPTNNGTYQPNGLLTNFNGENSGGIWTLNFEDTFDADGGSLDSWSVELCGLIVLPNFTISSLVSEVSVCSGTDAVFTIDIGETGGFSDPVTLTTNNLPAGLTPTFDVNPISPSASSVLTLSNTASVPDGIYLFEVVGNSTNGPISILMEIEILEGSPSEPSPISPANGQSGVSLNPFFTWAPIADAVSYEIEISDDPTFGTITESAAGLTDPFYTVGGALSQGTIYYWRVRASNICGNSEYSNVFSFLTSTLNCTIFNSTDIPVAIPTTVSTMTSDIVVSGGGTIMDINVINLTGAHTWINDLSFELTSPEATTVLLMPNICGNEDNFDINFDDAGSPGPLPCPPSNGGTYQPQGGALSSYNGENSDGTWTLTVSDGATGDGGSLNSWGLEICFDDVVAPPTIITNNTLTLIESTTDGISTVYLETTDPVEVAADIHYTVISIPGKGVMLLNGIPLGIGETFTQEDINNGFLTYQHSGVEVGLDEFVFNVDNGTGGWIGGETFNINITASLPIEGLDFRVKKEGLNVLVDWDVTVNSSAIGYEVDLALNSSSNSLEFQTIHQNDVFETIGEDYSYQFKDTSPNKSGIRYYRIRRLLQDGSVQYTEVKTVNFENRIADLIVFPNPFSDSFTLQWEGLDSEIKDIQIYDARGKLCRNLKEAKFSGKNELGFSLSDYPKGIYFMRVQMESDTRTIKIIKSN